MCYTGHCPHIRRKAGKGSSRCCCTPSPLRGACCGPWARSLGSAPGLRPCSHVCPSSPYGARLCVRRRCSHRRQTPYTWKSCLVLSGLVLSCPVWFYLPGLVLCLDWPGLVLSCPVLAGLGLKTKGGLSAPLSYPLTANRRRGAAPFQEGSFDPSGRALGSPIRGIRLCRLPPPKMMGAGPLLLGGGRQV